MKLLTITVPCYNCEESMRHCLDTLLPGGEDIEIILVNDGSTDHTAQIADAYAKQYPSIVRVIHQPAGGHGEGINTGILHATGLYFKIVDSDDRVDAESYQDVIRTLRNLAAGGCMLDMMISNVIYEKHNSKKKKAIRYSKVLPVNQLFDWSETKNIKAGKFFLIQSVIYRTQMLRDCHLLLPKHNHYADNLFVYVPLPYVKTMYYLDVDFYHCTVDGPYSSADDRSIQTLIDDHIYMNKQILDVYDIWKISSRPLRHYMLNYLEIITAVSSVMLAKTKGKESQEKRRELWDYIKKTDIRLYHKLRQRIMGQTLPLPVVSGHSLTTSIYKISQKMSKSNETR